MMIIINVIQSEKEHEYHCNERKMIPFEVCTELADTTIARKLADKQKKAILFSQLKEKMIFMVIHDLTMPQTCNIKLLHGLCKHLLLLMKDDILSSIINLVCSCLSSSVNVFSRPQVSLFFFVIKFGYNVRRHWLEERAL